MIIRSISYLYYDKYKYSVVLPAKLLDKIRSVFSYSSGKVNSIYSLQDNVVCFHWI